MLIRSAWGTTTDVRIFFLERQRTKCVAVEFEISQCFMFYLVFLKGLDVDMWKC